MLTGAAASVQPTQGPPQEDDLRRQDIQQQDDQQDPGSGEPNTHHLRVVTIATPGVTLAVAAQ